MADKRTPSAARSSSAGPAGSIPNPAGPVWRHYGERSMEIFERLANTLPRLRNQIQITGLFAIIAGFVATRLVEPSAVLGQLAAGSVGVLILIFGTLTPTLRAIPAAQRALVTIVALSIFLLLMVGLSLIAVRDTIKSARASELQTKILSQIGPFCEDALEGAIELVNIDPNNPTSFNIYGNVHFCLKKFRDAVDAWRQASVLAPNDESIRFNYGAGLIEMRCDECYFEAESIFADLGRNDVPSRYNWALLQALQGRYEPSVFKAKNVLNLAIYSSQDKDHLLLSKASFLLGVATFLGFNTSTNLDFVAGLFKEAERHEPGYICMLFGGESFSNTFGDLIGRAENREFYPVLLSKIKERGWGRTCKL